MKKLSPLLVLAALMASGEVCADTLKVKADRIAVDRNTESLMATGNVDAVCYPVHMHSAGLYKEDDGLYTLSDPTMLTTCTNELCDLHWSIQGSSRFKDGQFAIVKNAWVKMFGIPIFWLPYWYYAVNDFEGLRIMPGYTGRWGGYIMTKYVYHLLGDRERKDGSYYLTGNTRADWRYHQGFALGQTFYWQLGEYGEGKFKIYWAWDKDPRKDDPAYQLWGSKIPDDRFAAEFSHRWLISERDTFRVQGSLVSDSYFRQDYFLKTLFNIRNQWLGDNGNEFAWEHNENRFGLGLSASGPLLEFYGGTMRLPEIYLDIEPQPIFGSPFNYESETKFGFLRRKAADNGTSNNYSPYAYNPGPWAEYETFRLDTYHRITAPFKLFDVLSVVPRVGVRETIYGNSGFMVEDGKSPTLSTQDPMFRSIAEGGVTFAARGTAWLNEKWRHIIEPYVDVTVQEVWYDGVDDKTRTRPFIFDGLDASRDWFEQAAGRGRNLPYSYYGVTPGLRNTLQMLDNDKLSSIFDFDIYAAIQLNKTGWNNEDRNYKLADLGRPNYGEREITVYPGLSARLNLGKNARLNARYEHDCEDNRTAYAGLSLKHKIFDNFEYVIQFDHADYRYWDFASSPKQRGAKGEVYNRSFNTLDFSYAKVGFEHEICDAIVWSPYARYDCKDGKLDSFGGWVDYRLDCLGFRLILEYECEYERIDGTHYDDDVYVGFFMYLRAFGPASGDLTQNW